MTIIDRSSIGVFLLFTSGLLLVIGSFGVRFSGETDFIVKCGLGLFAINLLFFGIYLYKSLLVQKGRLLLKGIQQIEANSGRHKNVKLKKKILCLQSEILDLRKQLSGLHVLWDRSSVENYHLKQKNLGLSERLVKMERGQTQQNLAQVAESRLPITADKRIAGYLDNFDFSLEVAESILLEKLETHSDR